MTSLLVRDRMTAPAVTERPDLSVSALVSVLKLRGISAVPIVEKGKLVGIVSTTDILRAPDLSRAGDIMTRKVVTVSVDDRIDEAARRLAEARVHRVVAMQGTQVAGILSARDVLQEMKSLKIDAPISTAMTSPAACVDIGESIDDATQKLANANVHGLVVVDGEWPVGVFTHAEALASRRLPAELRSRPVEEVMSYETICLDRSTPMFRAAAYAISMNVRRILVVEHRRLVGVVSCLDLVDVLAHAEERPPAAVTATLV
ncbi:MAG: CBS domain-containing protein [Deltaproteobacteria bacterium]|nr:CBS domain-containing protein [Deltaproteobacteria bacterium]